MQDSGYYFMRGGGMEIVMRDALVDGMDGRTEDASTSFDPQVSSTRISSVNGMDGKFEEGLTLVNVNGRDGKLEDAVTLDGALHSLDYSTAPICNDLGLLEREKREQSAAKSDDAEVPEYLWFEHMFNNESWHWDSSMKRQIEKLSEWF
jgi:hypothetical protein